MEELAAALIAAALAVGVGALAVLHVLATGVSPVHDAVSRYGISRYRRGYRVQTIAYGIAGLGAAIGLARLPGSPGLAVALCVVFGLARLAISWFPMDLPGGARTEHGRRHGLLAIAAFVAAAIAAGALAQLLGEHHTHAPIASASRTLALLMLVDLLAMGATRRSGGAGFGLIERGFYLLMTAWLALVAALLAGA